MTVLLIALAFLFTLAILGLAEQRVEFRVAVLKCTILHGFAIVILTEVLSSVKLFTFTAVATFWLLVE